VRNALRTGQTRRTGPTRVSVRVAKRSPRNRAVCASSPRGPSGPAGSQSTSRASGASDSPCRTATSCTTAPRTRRTSESGTHGSGTAPTEAPMAA
jgi:hypothetical protein